jgi:hypothetical protein
MTETEWLGGSEVFWLLESDLISASVTDRHYRLFAAACCRRIWHLMSDPRARRAVEALERFADDPSAEVEREGALNALLSDEDVWRKQSGPQSRAMSAATECAGANGVDYLRLAMNVAEDCGGAIASPDGTLDEAAYAAEERVQCEFIRDMFGNPFRPVTFAAAWRTGVVLALAHGIYDSRDFSAMPILADALQDAGCDSADLLDHCRGPGPHVRGCWVLDAVLARE